MAGILEPFRIHQRLYFVAYIAQASWSGGRILVTAVTDRWSAVEACCASSGEDETPSVASVAAAAAVDAAAKGRAGSTRSCGLVDA